jgi:hypothetical protein
MEKKIGEVFIVKGVKLRCEEGDDCLYCHFNGSGDCKCELFCFSPFRRDGKNVIFKEYSIPSIIEVDDE